MTGLPWDASYHDGPAPWDIGRPQPAIVRLAAEGRFAGAVLDAGCGTGENALHVASLGLSVLGVDVAETALAIARAKASPTIGRYDRGVRWEEEGVAVRGTRWVSVYVPVWLYSYADSAKGEGSLVHYIAVNARTGETMGSVPVSQWRLLAAAFTVGTFLEGIAGWILVVSA